MTLDPNAPQPLVSSTDDAELRALLEAGRDELPSAAQLSALAAKLGPMLGPGSGGGHGGLGGAHGAVAKATTGATLAKVLGATTLAVLLGGAAVQAIRSRAPGSVPVAQAVSVAVTAASVPSAAPVPEPLPAEPASSPLATKPPAPSAPSRAASSVSASAPRVAASTSPVAEDADAEVKLLQDAQGALQSEPARTLALCTEHARRFPSGLMTQEREVLAIEALVRTGRTDDARARADRFTASYPSSTHLRRIRTVLGDAP